MNGRVMSALWLISRHWPLSQVHDGTASRIVLEAVKNLSAVEFRDLLTIYKGD